MIKTLATLPQDLGKKINVGGGMVVVVENTRCECCPDEVDQPATRFIQGETDSFGFEVIATCEGCLKTMSGQVEEYHSAADVEDRAPKPGHVFFVNEGTNIDSHYDWTRSFTSYREARAFYRRIDDLADRYAGLYPNKGVQEIPEEQAARIIRRLREEEARERSGDSVDAEEEAWEAQEYARWRSQRRGSW